MSRKHTKQVECWRYSAVLINKANINSCTYKLREYIKLRSLGPGALRLIQPIVDHLRTMYRVFD